jgi:hypothetical protein
MLLTDPLQCESTVNNKQVPTHYSLVPIVLRCRANKYVLSFYLWILRNEDLRALYTLLSFYLKSLQQLGSSKIASDLWSGDASTNVSLDIDSLKFLEAFLSHSSEMPGIAEEKRKVVLVLN